MEAKKKALSNGWIENVINYHNINLKEVKAILEKKEWQNNNQLYLRRIKANSRLTVKG
jgi:hypothetical protein